MKKGEKIFDYLFRDLVKHLLICLPVEGTKVSARRFIFDSNNKFTGWTSWEQYAACSTQCVSGYEKQTKECCDTGDNRLCYNLPWNHLKSLVGTCPNDGMWSDWSYWSICSVTCNTGSMTRKRNCTYNQPVTIPGFPCQGNATESKVCQMTLCPADGTWLAWSKWTTCSATCGGGTQRRHRTCHFALHVPQGNYCNGPSRDVQICNSNTCPVDGYWDDWESWGACSVSCGGGNQRRRRKCHFDQTAPHGLACVGQNNEGRSCNTEKCPVDGHWTPWARWSQCSVSCENGTHTRDRTCIFLDDAPHGNNCTGNGSDIEGCNNGPCPVDGSWSDWTVWTDCTVTCGNGTKSRKRSCDFPDGIPHGNDCMGASVATDVCNTYSCTPRSCFTCQGPPVICEKLNFPAECPLEKPFCINSLSNFRNASRNVDMRCGTREECYTGWFEKYRSDDKCIYFDQAYIYTNRFDCEFCCYGDNCNQFINPAIKWHP